jgi:CBS domain-containing protein
MNRKLYEVAKVKGNVVYSVTGDTSIKKAVDVMNIHNVGALMVLSGNGGIEGIFTERDVMKKLASTDDLVGHLPVREIMTRKENLVLITGDETIVEIMEIMRSRSVRHLPIVDKDGVLQGVISMRDVLSILLKDARRETEDMRNYLTGKYPG